MPASSDAAYCVLLQFRILQMAFFVMIAHRVIMRFDFAFNHEIVGNVGRVMKLLEYGRTSKTWSEFGEREHVIQASYKDNVENPTTYRACTVDPTAVTVLMESSNGCALNRLAVNEEWTALTRLMGNLVEEFKTHDVRRAGIRFIGMDVFDPPVHHLLCLELMPKTVLAAVTKNLGEITDVGYNMDGSGIDKSKYHLRFGPYDSDEVRKYFEHVQRSIGKIDKYNFVCDLDTYEENFEIKGLNPSKWASGMIEHNVLPFTHDLVNSLKDLAHTVGERNV